MILYNITINIDKQAEREWLHWMKNEHVPEIMATGLPIENKIMRLLTEVDNGGITYTFQYFFNTMEDYITYQKLYSPDLQQKHHNRYRDKYVSFRTLLEEL